MTREAMNTYTTGPPSNSNLAHYQPHNGGHAHQAGENGHLQGTIFGANFVGTLNCLLKPSGVKYLLGKKN